MSEHVFENTKGVLFDLDGVIHVGNTPVEGAAGTLRYLDSKGILYRFLTNTTTASRESLFKKMNGMGLPITVDDILTTHDVAVNYLRRLGKPKCYLLVSESVMNAYRGVAVSETDPDYIVIGDIGDRWSYALMNDLFNLIMNGAEVIALHSGRYWQTATGLQLDIGAFVAGLEYATGKTALVIGKPSPTFFNMGLKDLGLKKEEVVMIGDDIEADVGGAQRSGLRGVLVQTGKYRESDLELSRVRPDAVLKSVAELQRYL